MGRNSEKTPQERKELSLSHERGQMLHSLKACCGIGNQFRFTAFRGELHTQKIGLTAFDEKMIVS
jgi:hypothetical protein